MRYPKSLPFVAFRWPENYQVMVFVGRRSKAARAAMQKIAADARNIAKAVAHPSGQATVTTQLAYGDRKSHSVSSADAEMIRKHAVNLMAEDTRG